MQKFALENKLMEAEHIILEKKSSSTGENAYFSRVIIDSKGHSTVHVVTSNFHVERAREIFQKVSIFWDNTTTDFHILILSLSRSNRTFSQPFDPFTPKFKKYILPTFSVRIGNNHFHLNKLWNAKFSIPCDVIFLLRLQEKFEIDHSLEWKG